MPTPTTNPLPAGVIALPLARAPFIPPSPAAALPPPNGYYVKIVISPDTPQTPNPTPPPPHACLVDTGSCGIVVPESLLYVGGDVNGTLLPGVTKGGPATVYYEPSSDNLTGYYYTVAQLGLGADATGACATICANVTLVGAAGMNASDGMMGVGFGRPRSYGTNVFLGGAPYPSYLFTTQGIWLGYTPQNLAGAGAFKFQPLQPAPVSAPTASRWQTPAANFTFAPAKGGAQSSIGSALLDTGVNSMLLGLDTADWTAQATGAQVTIAWPDGNGGSIYAYTLTVTGTELEPGGKQNPDAPRTVLTVAPAPTTPKYIVPQGDTAPSFVNTGINVLQGAAFYYDAQVGQIGFAPYAS